MATSLQSLRQTMGLRLGELRTGTTTSAGNAGGTTAIDSVLADQPDDTYLRHFLKLTSGTDSGKARKLSDFTQSSGTMTIYTAVSAQIANSVTYELHKYDPDMLDEALKRTLKTIYPDLYIPWIDDNYITGNWLRNGGFEEWAVSTTPDKWVITSSTATKTTAVALKLFGSASLGLGTAIGSATQTETQNPRLLDLRGQTIKFKAWVKTAAASNARLRIIDRKDDGTQTSTNSLFHSGGNLWELLEIERSIPADAVEVQLQMRIETTTDAFFDHARLTGRTLYSYYLPASGWQDLMQVFIQRRGVSGDSGSESLDPCDTQLDIDEWLALSGGRIEKDGTDKILYLPFTLPEKYKLRLVGRKLLTVPTTDAGTTEIDAPQTDLVVAEAAIWFIRHYMGPFRSEEDRRYLAGLLPELKEEAKALKRWHFMSSPAASIKQYG